jgi:glutathione S-transferase
MSLVLYYSPMSTASITRLVLQELEVPYEPIRVDLKNGETKSAAFLKVNPNAKVPVLVHDGVSIWESAAITMYLGETFGVDRKLYPAAGPKRGEAMKWIVWANVTVGDAVGRYARNSLEWGPADERNAKAGDAGKKAMHDCLRILDDALEGTSFLLGEYTLADTHVNSMADWLRYMKVDMDSYPRLNAWSQRCAGRPAYGKFMAAGG